MSAFATIDSYTNYFCVKTTKLEEMVKELNNDEQVKSDILTIKYQQFLIKEKMMLKHTSNICISKTISRTNCNKI